MTKVDAWSPVVEHGPHVIRDALVLTVVRDTSALEQIKSDWDDLAKKCDDDAFFGAYPFISEAWERHRNDRRTSLHIIIIRLGNALVATVPLIEQREWFGTVVLKWLDSKTPLYDCILVDPAIDFCQVAEAVRDHLASARRVRKLKADVVPAGTTADRLLTHLAAKPHSFGSACTVALQQLGGWDDYFAKRSANTRQAYRRHIRLLEREGPVRFEHITDPAGMAVAIQWIFERKRDWVIERHGTPNWIMPYETEAYFQGAAATLGPIGKAFILRLMCGEECVSSALCFASQRTIYLSKMAFDPKWRKFSPGWLLIMETVRLAFGIGVDKVDLMTGADDWKERFTDNYVDIRKYRLAIPLFRINRLQRRHRKN